MTPKQSPDEMRAALLRSGMRDTHDGRHFDKAGQPISPIEWTILFEDTAYRVVARTDVPGGYVSTVWLGLDHGFGRGHRQIFESMDLPGMDRCERYATIEEALAGHEEMVREMGALQ